MKIIPFSPPLKCGPSWIHVWLENIKQSQSHFINMDIKINSVASVTVDKICQLAYPGCQRVYFVVKLSQLRYKKETLWHPGYNWCSPFIEINIIWPVLFELTSFPFK